MNSAPMVDIKIFTKDSTRWIASKMWHTVPRVGEEIMIGNRTSDTKKPYRVTRVVWGLEGPDTPRDWQAVNLVVEEIADADI